MNRTVKLLTELLVDLARQGRADSNLAVSLQAAIEDALDDEDETPKDCPVCRITNADPAKFHAKAAATKTPR